VLAARHATLGNSSWPDLERNVMFARVNSVQTTADKLAGLVTFCEEGLPAFREASGFKGFYLLADRQSGKVVTISLWGSDDDLRQLEARAAQVRKEASSDVGIDSPPEDIYEVVLHA
jgi:heme-degrading monooxygenase HmoA